MFVLEVDTLIQKTLEAMEADHFHKGYIASSRKNMMSFLSYAETHQYQFFSNELVEEYLSQFPDNFDNKNQHKVYLSQYRTVRRLQRYLESGIVYLEYETKPVMRRIAPNFLSVIGEYDRQEEESGLSRASLIKNQRPVCYLFEYMTELGHTKLSDIQPGDTLNAIERMLEEHYTPSSLATALSGMRRLYKMFSELQPYAMEIPSRILRKVDIIEVYTEEEQKTIRDFLLNPVGVSNRDVAICFLSFETGLRNVDICGLKKTNIEWKNNRINILQSKTRQPLSLPIRSTYGNAMVDYLRFERPRVDSEYFFLTVTRPYRKLNNTWGIIKSILEKAGIDSHSRILGTRMFRHNAASVMVSKEVPITEIKEELGHTQLDSTMRYVSTDKEKMRLLTLSCPKGGLQA